MNEHWVTRRGQKTAHAVLFRDGDDVHTVCNEAGGGNMISAEPTSPRCKTCSQMLLQAAKEKAANERKASRPEPDTGLTP